MSDFLPQILHLFFCSLKLVFCVDLEKARLVFGFDILFSIIRKAITAKSILSVTALNSDPKILEAIVIQLMPERSINFRLNSETAKLYEEYREKYTLGEISDSQIIRAGLAQMMAMPEAVSGDEIDELIKKQDQLIAEMRKIFEKNPDPQVSELWKKLMETMNKMENYFTKTAEKYSTIVGDGKKGRKPDPNKKHTPGRTPKSETGYNS